MEGEEEWGSHWLITRMNNSWKPNAYKWNGFWMTARAPASSFHSVSPLPSPLSPPLPSSPLLSSPFLSSPLLSSLLPPGEGWAEKETIGRSPAGRVHTTSLCWARPRVGGRFCVKERGICLKKFCFWKSGCSNTHLSPYTSEVGRQDFLLFMPAFHFLSLAIREVGEAPAWAVATSLSYLQGVKRGTAL